MSHTGAGEQIAAGRTSIIYAWGKDQIVKVVRSGWDAKDLEHEARIARAVHDSGLPVPEVGPIVDVGGVPGLVYERVFGSSMLAQFGRNPWRLVEFAHLTAHLHHQMHSVSVSGMPDLVEKQAERIRVVGGLSDVQRESLLRRLSQLPVSNRLCHGDFHPDNIIMAEQGPVIIDWVDASRGNAAADVTRTTLLMRSVWCNPKLTTRPLALAADMFGRAYLREYMRQSRIGTAELDAWAPILAASRLAEGVPGESGWLLRQAGRGWAANA